LRSGEDFGIIILIPGGKEGGMDLEVAGEYKGAFERIVVSIRVHA